MLAGIRGLARLLPPEPKAPSAGAKGAESRSPLFHDGLQQSLLAARPDGSGLIAAAESGLAVNLKRVAASVYRNAKQ